MPDHDSPPPESSGLATRIDLAERLDAALDGSFEAAIAMAGFLPLAAEIRGALHRPVLSVADRARIHDRAVDIAGARGPAGLRLAWPQRRQLGQLAHRGVHPAVLGGAAAAVLAVVGVAGVAALQRRGHGGPGVLQAA